MLLSPQVAATLRSRKRLIQHLDHEDCLPTLDLESSLQALLAVLYTQEDEQSTEYHTDSFLLCMHSSPIFAGSLLGSVSDQRKCFCTSRRPKSTVAIAALHDGNSPIVKQFFSAVFFVKFAPFVHDYSPLVISHPPDLILNLFARLEFVFNPCQPFLTLLL
jgi:hypothetical protein